jgi:hypothetical protein
LVKAKDKMSKKVLHFLNVGKRKTYAKCVALFRSTKLFLRICVEVLVRVIMERCMFDIQKICDLKGRCSVLAMEMDKGINR